MSKPSSKLEKQEKYKKKYKKNYLAINKLHLKNDDEYQEMEKEQKQKKVNFDELFVKKPKTKFDDLFDKIKKTDYKSYIRIETNFGNLNFEIFASETPIASLNFIRLCQQKKYNNSIFHRMIPGFMMQGGKIPSNCIYEKPFPNEINENIKFEFEGLLGMANTGPNSNTTEFFVTFAPLNHLNDKYSCFGKLVGGKKILKQIESVERTKSDKPLKDIKILNTIVYFDPFEELSK
eukprot:gene4354-7710_t